MCLTHPTRILITPCSQNNHCSWTSWMSPTLRAHHMQTVTYYNSSKTPQPRTTFWKTAREARTTFHSHRKRQSQNHAHQTHYLSLQHLCWTLPLICCKPPDINKKIVGPPNHQRLQAKLSFLLLWELSDRCHNARAQTLLSDMCRVPAILAATFTNVYRTSGNPVCL